MRWYSFFGAVEIEAFTGGSESAGVDLRPSFDTTSPGTPTHLTVGPTPFAHKRVPTIKPPAEVIDVFFWQTPHAVRGLCLGEN